MADQMVIRPARPDDRPAMEHICAHTWEHGDYIPQVWDEWLADENGVLIVGELGAPQGQVVALCKISFQEDGQAWLEGMRVDPEYRGRGIGKQFLQFELEYARNHGARAVRLATGGNNTVVHHMAAHQGMNQVGVYTMWQAEPLPGGPQPAFLRPEDAPQVKEFLHHSPVLAYTQGLYTVDWAAQELSDRRVDDLLNRGQVAAERTSEGDISALIVVCLEPGDDELWIGFADGLAPVVSHLATAVRGYVAQAAVERIRTMLPDLDWLKEAFRAAGFDRGEWDGELWVFESRTGQAT